MQLGYALAEYGVKETSRNRGPRVDEYIRGTSGRFGYLLKDRPAWCCLFGKWAIDMAANTLVIPSPFPSNRDLASVLKVREWAENVGKLREYPEPGFWGCVVSKDADGTQIRHLWTVVDVAGDEELTIEGNTPNGVDSKARFSELTTFYVQPW